MRIHAGKRPRASRRVENVSPSFSFLGWTLTVDQKDHLVYRPGFAPFLLRLLFAAVMIAVALLFLYGYDREVRSKEETLSRIQSSAAPEQDVFDSALAAGLDASTAARIQQEHEARLAAPRPVPFGMSAQAQRAVRWGVAVFIAVMLLFPLSVVWNRVEFSASPRGELVVKSWHVVPRTLRIPWPNVGGIQYGVEETIHRTTRGQITGHYWTWHVRLKSKFPGAPSLAVFSPCKQPDRPGAESRPPRQVAHLIHWFLAHVPVKVSGPYLVEKTLKRGGLGTEPKASILAGIEQGGLRQDPLGGMAGGIEDPSIHRTVNKRFIIRDADGREQHYDSLEKVPHEIRRRIEELRRQGKGQE